MTRWLSIKLPSAVLLALLLLIAPGIVTGAAMAAADLEILQAVRNGVPNSGDNRVVIGEVFARDG